MGTYHRFIIDTKLVKKDKKTKEEVKEIIEKFDHPKVVFSETQGISIDDTKLLGELRLFKLLRKHLIGKIRVINLDNGEVIDYLFGEGRNFKKDYPDYFVRIRV